MSCGLTPASRRSPFYNTTTQLSGMLLCIFTTLAVLMSVSQEQSGATLSEVKHAFNRGLRDHGRNDVAVIAAAFRQQTSEANSEHSDKSRLPHQSATRARREDELSTASEEEPSGLFLNEKPRPVDVNGPVFLNLMTELQRYCHVSPIAELGGQVALDLHSQIPQSEEQVHDAIERILKTCLNAKDSAGRSPAEFEVIIWASTPATESLASAVAEAYRLEQSLKSSWQSQSVQRTTVSSSGRIWTRPSITRPLATVIVRAAGR